MKKIFLGLSVILTLVLASSCLKNQNSSYKNEYYAVCGFDYSLDQYKDSVLNYFRSGYLFAEGALFFYDKGDEDELAGGFGLSMKCDPVVKPGHKTRSVMAVCDTAAYRESTGFAVFRQSSQMPDYGITFNYASEPDCYAQIRGMFVCNTNYMANIMAYGQDGIPAFREGDYLRLTVNSDSGASSSIDLASFKDGKLTYIHDWTSWDVSKVGAFKALQFTLTSNRSDIPLYCCLDDVTAYVHVEY